MRTSSLWLALLAVVGCGTPVPSMVEPTRSSSIAVSRDGTRVVAVAPDDDALTVYNPVSLVAAGMVALPFGTEPSSVALHPDGETAFVTLRKRQVLLKVTHYRSSAI